MILSQRLNQDRVHVETLATDEGDCCHDDRDSRRPTGGYIIRKRVSIPTNTLSTPPPVTKE